MATRWSYTIGENTPLTRKIRAPARLGRVFAPGITKTTPNASYLEVGGMRYSAWDGTKDGGGHRLVTTVIKKLDLDKDSVPFNKSANPLYYLRAKNMYLNDITSSNPAPYNVNNYGATDSPDTAFTTIQDIAVTQDQAENMTRADWCKFYKEGTIQVELGDSSIYKKGDLLKDIGYWNLMFDQLGSEGYQYTSDGNGYTSNVINWNAADAIQSNNEFTPGTEYKTLKTGLFQHVHGAIRRDYSPGEKERRQIRLSPRYAVALHPADRWGGPLLDGDARASRQSHR